MKNAWKKTISIVLIVLLVGTLFLIGGCKKKEPVKPVVEEPTQTEEPVVPSQEEDALNRLKMGIVPENKFSIGTSGDQIALHLGTPEAEDWFTGHYLQYGNIIYFTDGLDQENRGKLLAIDFGKDEVVFGQKVGASVEDIKAAFGKVDESGWMDAESELYSGQWYMSFIRGDYVLTVYADNEKGTSTNMRVETRR